MTLSVIVGFLQLVQVPPAELQYVETEMPRYAYDKYSNQVSMSYATGGYIDWACHLWSGSPSDKIPQAYRCDGTETIGVQGPNGKPVVSKQCEAGIFGLVNLRVDLNEQTEFGTYRCAATLQGGNLELLDRKEHNIDYLICDDAGPTCKSSPSCADENSGFCIITSKSKATCAKPESIEERCKFNGYHRMSSAGKICPVDTWSLCHAAGVDYSRAWSFFGDSDKGCQELGDEKTYPRFVYLGKPRLYYEALQLDPSQKTVYIEHSHGGILHQKQIHCKISNDRGETLFDHPLTLNGKADLSLDDTLFETTQVYALLCHTDSRLLESDTYIISVRIVSLDGGKLAIKQENVNELVCGLVPTPSNEFTVTYWWSKKSGTLDVKQRTLRVIEQGEYTCHANVTYRTCSPFREFQATLKPVSYTFTPASTTTTTTGKSTSTSRSTSSSSPSPRGTTSTTGQSGQSSSPTGFQETKPTDGKGTKRNTEGTDGSKLTKSTEGIGESKQTNPTNPTEVNGGSSDIPRRSTDTASTSTTTSAPNADGNCKIANVVLVVITLIIWMHL